MDTRLPQPAGALAVSLDVIRVAEPCPVPWDGMCGGDDRARFCPQCNRFVHNLSAMRRAEAEAVLAGPGGLPCVRFVADHTGAVETLDSPRRRGGPARGWRRVAAALLPACLATALGLGGCMPTQGKPVPRNDAVGDRPGGAGEIRGRIELMGEPVAVPNPSAPAPAG